MKNKLKKIILKKVKQIVLGLVIFVMVFPYNTLVVLADSVPVEETGWNREWNFRTSEYTNSMVELLGEIMAPIYQLATPGSYLTKDIYSYIMKNTENELGIDKDFFRRMQRKQAAPTVDIIFAPTNPKVGEKVTAFAIPRDFKNNKDRLYFTWYIVHDGETNVEAGRAEAMRMVAAGNYDEGLFGTPLITDSDDHRDAYNASIGGDDGVGKKSKNSECDDSTGCDCVEDMTMMNGEIEEGCYDDRGELLYRDETEYGEAKDDRGENSADLGRGVVNSDFITRCYRHNFGIQNEKGEEDSGRDLIISCKHTFSKDGIGEDDNEFDFNTERSIGTNPTNPDTDGDGVLDEADLVGLGQDEFTWIYRKGDKVSVAVEGMSNIVINEGTTDRLRYKNKKDESDSDLSPALSPETWYKDKREECQNLRASASNNDYSDCMKELWAYERKSDKNDEDAFGDMTSYYKIMWAAPGICTEGTVVSKMTNDWCDNDSDRGFQFLKLYDPAERGAELLEVSIDVSPKNPQFKEPEEGDLSEEHSDSTDRIIASASVVSQDNINPDYLYYKWSVWRCDKNDFDECEDMTDELTDNPKFRSRLEGIGLSDMWFYPDDFIIDENRTLLKIGVIVKKHKNSLMSSPGINGEYTKQIFSDEKKELKEDKFVQKYAYSASKLIEITRHKMSIKLYQAKPNKDGFWEKDKEICGKGSEKDMYRKICPVYQYQVLMAEVENAGEAISWQLNGKNIGQTLNGKNNQNPNSAAIFFPITGIDGEVGSIKVTSEIENKEGLWEDDNISEARVFSVHRPMAKILDSKDKLDSTSIKRAYAGAYNGGKGYYRRYKDDELWWIADKNTILPWGGREGIVNIPVAVIPRYLQDEVDGVNLILQSYVNGIKKGNLAPGDKGIFEKVKFNNKKDEYNQFRVRVIRQFSDEHKKALKQSFGIVPLDELVNDLEIKVKAISDDKYFEMTGEKIASGIRQEVGKFFASTIKNSPMYLVFILRLAVSFVLVVMITFGLARGAKHIN